MIWWKSVRVVTESTHWSITTTDYEATAELSLKEEFSNQTVPRDLQSPFILCDELGCSLMLLVSHVCYDAIKGTIYFS